MQKTLGGRSEQRGEGKIRGPSRGAGSAARGGGGSSPAESPRPRRPAGRVPGAREGGPGAPAGRRIRGQGAQSLAERRAQHVRRRRHRQRHRRGWPGSASPPARLAEPRQEGGRARRETRALPARLAGFNLEANGVETHIASMFGKR
ncbi:Hypothetical predicted protein [Podarcis lilfordi]|uniref:Uncharacterized protein n=1 Tax=Podarcis lilfordi TaxID=74358 RepID=A0AA35LKH7_9SAUR|nr:Hypothetical predicted protein [Podarcis lilfordi]